VSGNFVTIRWSGFNPSAFRPSSRIYHDLVQVPGRVIGNFKIYMDGFRVNQALASAPKSSTACSGLPDSLVFRRFQLADKTRLARVVRNCEAATAEIAKRKYENTSHEDWNSMEGNSRPQRAQLAHKESPQQALKHSRYERGQSTYDQCLSGPRPWRDSATDCE